MTDHPTSGYVGDITPEQAIERLIARVAELDHQLSEARESERADVVAWLRGLHWTHVHNQEALFFAAAIEEGVHT